MGWGGYNFDSDRQTSSSSDRQTDRVFFVLHWYRGLPSDGLITLMYSKILSFQRLSDQINKLNLADRQHKIMFIFVIIFLGPYSQY